MAAPWQLYADAGPTDQATACLKCATTPSTRLSLHSLPLSPSVLAEAEKGDATVAMTWLSSRAVVVEPLPDSSHPEHRHALLYLLHPLAVTNKSR